MYIALHYACLFGQAGAVRVLLKSGASPSPENTLGLIPKDLLSLHRRARPRMVHRISRLLRNLFPRYQNANTDAAAVQQYKY
jgi:ankyrin repeat protein